MTPSRAASPSATSGRPAASSAVVSEPVAARRTVYSPDLRTAVVLTGTGADGAYHAGVLHALQEAGVRVDVLAGHGIGAVGALFAAIDGGARLWSPTGLWRSRSVARLYRWRGILRVLALSVAAGALILAVPAVMLAVGLLVYETAGLLDVAGPGTAARATACLCGARGVLVQARWAADLVASPCADARGVRRGAHRR